MKKTSSQLSKRKTAGLAEDPISCVDVGTIDCGLIYAWANDPTSRANSFNSDPIDYDKHMAWFKQKLDDPLCKILVFRCGEEPIGMVRLEKKSYGVELGITLAPEKRGLGLGKIILSHALRYRSNAWGGGQVYAHIKCENLASVAIFQSCGFVKTTNTDFKGNICIEMVCKDEY